MKRLFACTLLLFAAAPTFAADANGYTAKHEKHIGMPPPCSTVISSVNDPNWAKLNDSTYPVICITPGDYSSRGKITLNAKGSSNAKRWLYYYHPQDVGAKPWRQDQNAGDRVKIKGIVFDGASHWIVHRITVDGDGAAEPGLISFSSNTNANNNIIDSVLVEDGAVNLVNVGYGNSSNTIQNSVLRDCRISKNTDSGGIAHFGAVRTHTVNNEIFGCVKAIYISEHSAPGTIIENNDLYVPPKLYTDCYGSYNMAGPCSTTESVIGTKNGGTSTELVKILHNRIWGNRKTDTNLCCASGGQGSLAFIGGKNATADPVTTGAKYTLFKNNILMDSQIGIASYWGGVRNNSFVGNIIYDIRQHNTSVPSHAIGTGFGYASEVYLNTIINANAWVNLGGANNNVRCNVLINSGQGKFGIAENTQVVNNAFFNTSGYSTSSLQNEILGQSALDAKGTEFCFYKKLQTGPERTCIPNAVPTINSPHRNSCDSAAIGLRTDIGVGNDSQTF